MKLNTLFNTKRNIIWGYINKIINILLPFLTRTIIIYELGISYIGLGSLFSSILSTLSLAEFGFDIGIVTIMYQGIAENNNKKICALLNIIKKAYFGVGCVILVLGCFCIPFIHLLIKDIDAIPDGINIYILFFIFLMNTVTSYFFGGYKKSILEAYQRQDIVSNVNSVLKIALFLVQLIILMYTKNYYLYSLAILGFGIITNIITYFITYKLYPEMVPSGKIGNEERNKLKKILFGTFLSKFGTVLNNSFDNIVISAFLGIELLGYYSNYSYIFSSIQGFMVVIYISLQAGFGNDVALESVDYNYQNLGKYTFGYSWILGWCTICLMYLSSPFVELWIGIEGVLPTTIIFLCVLCFYVSNCFAILGTYKNAIGIWWEDRYRCLINGFANLAINIVMVVFLKRFGEVYSLAGIVVSTIITTGFIGIPWSTKVTFDVYFKKGLKKHIFELLSYFVNTYINMLLCYPIMDIISNKYIKNGVAVLLLRGVTLCIIPNIVYLFIYRKNPYFNFFKKYCKKNIWNKG